MALAANIKHCDNCAANGCRLCKYTGHVVVAAPESK